MRRRRAGAAVLLGMLLAGPSRGDQEPSPSAPGLEARLRTILLGERGPMLVCPGCPGEAPLRIDPATGQATEVLLPYESVEDIAQFADGKKLLVSTSADGGKRSQLLILAVDSLAPTGRVEISGRGEELIVARDGYRAYVLSHRPERGHPDDPGAGEWSLLGVDLGESRVIEKYPLASRAFDLALSESEDRLFVALADRIQSFTIGPLTASWQYRSPGANRCLAVRPGGREIFAIRDDQIAIFPFPPGRQEGGGEAERRSDDAESVMAAPTHVSRLGFSSDGRIGVAAGRGLDQLVVLDLEARRVSGIWPQDASQVSALVAAADAASRPRGPRGKLAARQGYAPPFDLPVPPAPTRELSSPTDRTQTVVSSPVPPPGPRPEATPPAPLPPASPGARGVVSTQTSPLSASSEPRPEVAGSAPPAPETPARESAGSGAPSPSTAPEPAAPTTAAAGPEPGVAPTSGIEEIEDRVLSGRIGGRSGMVVEVLLFGPNSLVAVYGRSEPAADGTFSFKLPPKGRYRIVPMGAAGKMLVSRPPFLSLEVGEYGFRGLDFRILGVLGGPASTGH